PGELSRYRRRRQRAGDGERARGDQQRPVGAVDLHQHLRGHHQGRGGRERHRASTGSGRDRVTDRDPPRRNECRAGSRDPFGVRIRPAREQADDGGRCSHGSGDGGGAVVSILVNAETRVIVQGITGGQGRFYALRNRAYGTSVVGGVSPKKAGTDVDGIPVFASVADAVRETGATATMVIVPAAGAASAVLEAAVAGLELIVVVTE